MIGVKSGQDYYQQEINQKRSAGHFREILIWGGVVFLIASLFILYLVQSIQYAQISYHLQLKKQQLDLLRKENHQLDLERAKLASLERIEGIARNQLRMKDPHQVEYVTLNNPTGFSDQGLIVEKKRIDYMIKEFVFNWLENVSRVEAGTLFD